jgi:hypothetical protein
MNFWTHTSVSWWLQLQVDSILMVWTSSIAEIINLMKKIALGVRGMCSPPQILWCSQIGDHSHEDLAKYGCRLDMRRENFQNPFTFCLLVATCCTNMAPKYTKNWDLANLGHFFTKILCIHQNPIFQVLKMWKFSKRKNVVWDCWRMYLKFKIQIHVF